MPELPEVEAWRLLAERRAVGKTITRAESFADDIIFDQADHKKVARVLKDKPILAAHRRGKHLWLDCDDTYPYFHFGMSGSFEAYDDPADAPTYPKIILHLDDGTFLAYRNVRRIGRVRLLTDPLNDPPISALGFDAYLQLPPTKHIAAILAKKRGPIKSILLDQSFAAGVGNWIADEILYQAALHPRTRGCDLTPAQVQTLRRKMKSIIDKACAVEANADRFPKTWLFHHRWGKNKDAQTARGETIEFDTIGGRTTAWVPAAQQP